MSPAAPPSAPAPLTETEVDVVVVGAGPVGENVAQYAHDAGDLTVALVEAERVGGECSYWACMPSKALLRPIEVAGAAAHLDGVADAPVLPEGLLARRDAWRSHLDDAGQASWVEDAGLELVRGRGRLAGERRVEVTGDDGARVLRARHAVVLATGSVPVVPRPLAAVHPWTSRDATGVVEVPARLAIVGGGAVAVEAATWMAALGAQVTLLVRGGRLLAGVEGAAGELVAAGLRRAGVDVRLHTQVASAARADVDPDAPVGVPHGGPVRLVLAGPDDARTPLEVDEVLAATGRRPALEGVGLESVGLTPQDVAGDSGVVSVPAAGGAPWLHVVGDAADGPALTHWGKHQAMRLGERIAAWADGAAGPEAADDPDAHGAPEALPQVVFTSPQAAQVGLTAEAARRAGRRVRVVEVPLTSAAGASLLRDDAEGRARLVIEGEHVVGAGFVGFEVAELLHAATIAVLGRVPLRTLRRAVPAYPTASEVWLRLVEAALGDG